MHRVRLEAFFEPLPRAYSPEEKLSWMILPCIWSSRFSPSWVPLAPSALPDLIAITDPLTSAWTDSSVPSPCRYPCFTHPIFRPFRLQPPDTILPSLPTRSARQASCFPTVRRAYVSINRSGLRASLAVSSQCLAESSLLSYGLVVRLLLLSTPPRDGAVTVRLHTLRADMRRTFTFLIRCAYRRTSAEP